MRRAPPGARSEKSAGAKENPVTMEVHAMSTMAMVATDGKDIRKNPVTDTKGGQSKGTTGQMVIWCRGSFSQLCDESGQTSTVLTRSKKPNGSNFRPKTKHRLQLRVKLIVSPKWTKSGSRFGSLWRSLGSNTEFFFGSEWVRGSDQHWPAIAEPHEWRTCHEGAARPSSALPVIGPDP